MADKLDGAPLISRIRKARETRVQLGPMTFVVRRPTDVEMLELRNTLDARTMLRFIVDWDGVRECDIDPAGAGGSTHPVLFNADLAVEWLQDRLDLLGPLIVATVKAYEDHVRALGEARKN